MMNSIHHAVPLNAILMRQDEATNDSIAKVVDCAVVRFMQSNMRMIIIDPPGLIILVTETYCPILHVPHLSFYIMDYTSKTVYLSSKYVFDATAQLSCLVTETNCPILHGPHLPCNIMDYTNETVYSSFKFVFDATQYPCPPTGSSLFASATPSSTPFAALNIPVLQLVLPCLQVPHPAAQHLQAWAG